MGWDISETGFKIVLSADVPWWPGTSCVPTSTVPGIAWPQGLRHRLLGLPSRGSKVLEAMQESLDLPAGSPGRDVAQPPGSGKPLFDLGAEGLAETLENHRPRQTATGVLLAMARASLRAGAAPVVSDTRILYTVLVALVAWPPFRAADRSRNRSASWRGASRGGARPLSFDGGPPHRAPHLVPVEVWLLRRPFMPLLAGRCLSSWFLAGALRWWVIKTP